MCELFGTLRFVSVGLDEFSILLYFMVVLYLIVNIYLCQYIHIFLYFTFVLPWLLLCLNIVHNFFFIIIILS